MEFDKTFKLGEVDYYQDVDPRDNSVIETKEHFDDVVSYLTELYYSEKSRPASPYSKWSWDPSSDSWVAPLAKPTDGKDYEWNDEEGIWNLVEGE